MLFLVVRLQFAEQLHGSLEFVRRKLLAAHHQHMMLGEGVVKRGAGLGIDGSGEIEAA